MKMGSGFTSSQNIKPNKNR